jgi:FkbM family methyltransferase
MKAHKFAHFPIVQAFVRAVYPYGSIRKVQRGRLRGRRVIIGPGMGFTYIWNLQGKELDWVQQVGKDDCVYDIGANCGQSTLHIADAVGPDGMVVAFEPMPDSYQSLVRNIELNGLGFVIPVRAAVAATEGMAQFLFDRDQPTMGRLSSANWDLANAQVMEVHQLALDSYDEQGWPAPSFLKIDVEGGASAVFAGGHELIRRCRPAIYIELHSNEEREAVRTLLAQHDYRAFSMTGVAIADPTVLHYTQLFCRPV